VKKDNTLEDRMAELECSFLFQQETLDALSGEVSKQWKQIDQLLNHIKKLSEQMVSLENNIGDSSEAGAMHEPPPPHY